MDDDNDSQSMGEIFDSQCNTIDVELINLVKQRPALYDIRVAQKDRTKSVKEALWDDISKCMEKKLKPIAAEMRWKYLRENYIKARKKQKLKEEVSKKTGVPPKVNKYNRKYAYRYHEQMLFLNDALDYQKMITMDNVAKLKRHSRRRVQTHLNQQKILQMKIKSTPSNNDSEESTLTTDALFDHQYNTVAITVKNNEPDYSLNSPTKEVNSDCTLNSTVKSEDKIINYDELLVKYLHKTTEKLSPIDGFLARLGEGLKRLPYRERSELEIEFLSRLHEVEGEVGLL